MPFLLFFWGLSLTPAPVAGFIQKTQFLWVALLAGPLLGEALGRWQALALVGLLAGTLLQAPVGAGSGGGRGPGAGRHAAVVGRGGGGAPDAAAGAPAHRRRGPHGGGAVVMLGFLALSGRLPVLAGLTPVQWGWVAGPGLLLLAYVLTWYHALRRAPALVVTSVLTLGAPVTALLDAVLVSHRWPAGPVLGGLLLAAGAALLFLAGWSVARRATRAGPQTAPMAPLRSYGDAS